MSSAKLSVADTAADAFKTSAFPRKLTQVHSFLGACNVYCRFVKGFAKITHLLGDMTCKDTEPDFNKPTKIQLQSVRRCRSTMIAPPIPALPRYGRPYST